MKLTSQERTHLDLLTARLKNHEKVRSMKNYIQHGTISTYKHCSDVAELSFWLNKRLHLHADEKVLVTGAMLHDFYLYDWHVKGDAFRLHGFYHPGIAAKNATDVFHINAKEENIIRSHMWPLTVTRLPKSREAWIVCAADKVISTRETLFMRKNKDRNVRN